jgi:hypothetical protein
MWVTGQFNGEGRLADGIEACAIDERIRFAIAVEGHRSQRAAS